MAYSIKIRLGGVLKAVFSFFAVIPLFLIVLALNNGLPRSLGTSQLMGVPVSILLLLILMFFQVALTWGYLRCFPEGRDANS